MRRDHGSALIAIIIVKLLGYIRVP